MRPLPAPTPARPLVVITGAGVSAASGIPTFRGPEGYWTVGSRVYQPMELATRAAWRRMPREVWRWYLYRKGVCQRAEPNEAHRSLLRLEQRLGDAFVLISQNVDGLHLRAGHDPRRVCSIHGDIHTMRDEVDDALTPVPDALALPDRDTPLDDARWAALVHPTSGRRCRPHVLWFDETYDERLYRASTALDAAARASTLVVCGTSGAASLPWHCAELAIRGGATLVDISPDPDPFREMASRAPRGQVVEASAVDGFAELEAAVPR